MIMKHCGCVEEFVRFLSLHKLKIHINEWSVKRYAFDPPYRNGNEGKDIE